jgi:hypothetical protein
MNNRSLVGMKSVLHGLLSKYESTLITQADTQGAECELIADIIGYLSNLVIFRACPAGRLDVG